MLKILPSIASANQLCIKNEIDRIGEIGYLHIDMEDGNFIDNITFGRKMISAISREFNGKLDVHMMTVNPEHNLDWLADLGVGAVCAHIEALPYPKQFIQHVHSLGMKAGLAFNLKTNPSEILSYSDVIDYVLVMTSEPDYEDQKIFDCAPERVAMFKSLLPATKEIWCDGGIRPEHLDSLYKAGMTKCVMGRSVWNSDNPYQTIQSLEERYKC